MSNDVSRLRAATLPRARIAQVLDRRIVHDVAIHSKAVQVSFWSNKRL